MKPALALREKLHGSQPVLGVLISYWLSVDLIEVCLQAGLDFAIIDAEHFEHDRRVVADVCSVGRLTGFPILLRPPSTESTALRLAMDLGPCGLLLPMIDGPEQLDLVCKSIYLPPRGERRPGGPGNRWLKSFDYESFQREIEDTLVVIPQVESPTGLENASAIAAHPLTTALGMGPFDLSARLGVCGDVNHPRMIAAEGRLQEAAQAAEKTVLAVGDGATLLARGFRFLCIAEPTLLMQASLTQLAAHLRATSSERTSGAG